MTRITELWTVSLDTSVMATSGRIRLSVNDRQAEVPDGASVLDAVNSAGVRIPALCHDPRLQPVGACRLCFVEIAGQPHPVTACNSKAVSGMNILTETPSLLTYRKSMLELLAENYPADAVKTTEQNELNYWLQHFGIVPQGARSRAADDSNPYIHVDMSQCIRCFRCVRICNEVQGQFVWNIRNRGQATSIIAGLGTLGESSCVSCGACVDTCPTEALLDKKKLEVGEPTTWTRTVCPYCGTGCELFAGTRDGQLIAIKPAIDGAVNKGHLCSKGRYAFDFVHAQDRILRPMIRQNRTWQEVSWDDAIAAAARALEDAVRSHGTDSVAVLGSARASNEEAYLAQKFARVVLGTNNVDCCARVCHAPTAAALKQSLGMGAATNSFNDIEGANSVLICGCNPTENHPVVGARIKQAVLRGARLVVIDPREIELSRFADVHLRIRPGTDIPVLNAMAYVLIEENLYDSEFVEQRIVNWEEFEHFILQYPPEAASQLCGVQPHLIRQAAQIYAETRPSMCFHGLGVTEHVRGTEGVLCLTNLALLTGNLGKPGCGINPLRGQNNVQGAAHMGCDPGLLTGSAALKNSRPLFQEIWKAEIPERRGLNLMEMMDAAEQGDLKAMWCIGYDILHTNPNISATRRALTNMDAVIVQDMFLNETAREFGTVFLPACSSFEKDGTFMNAERRIQRIRKALPPIDESRADWEIICQLAKAMGKAELFSYSSPADIWEDVRTLWPAGAGISYQRLEDHGLQWPCPDENHAGTAILHQDSFPFGKRTSLHCAVFKQSPEEATNEYPFILMTGRTLQQFNAGTMTRHGGHQLLRPTDVLDISLVDAKALGVGEGERVSLRSRYGEVTLPVHVTGTVSPGELFTTFHDAASHLNVVTGPQRDARTSTPEYKITAVHVEKIQHKN